MRKLLVSLTTVVATLAQADTVSLDLLEDHPWRDGLYSTVTVVITPIGDKPDTEKVKLRVDGSEIKVQLSARGNSGSLVVLLPGTSGLATDPMPTQWTEWLESAGHNVLAIDSTFNPRTTAALPRGLAGNLRSEAQTVAKIIEAALAVPQLRGRVSQVHLVGMSYGGFVALNVPYVRHNFAIGQIQAFSTPVTLRGALERLDEYTQFRWRLSDLLWEFGFGKRAWPAPSKDPEMMREAIGRIFREDLKSVINANEKLFRRQLLASPQVRQAYRREECSSLAALSLDSEIRDGQDANRKDYANVPFLTYFECMLAPYWVGSGQVQSEQDLLDYGDVAKLLSGLSAEQLSRSEVMVAENDPLNQQGAARSLASVGSSVNLLPRGGHLGYFDSAWAKAKLLTLSK